MLQQSIAHRQPRLPTRRQRNLCDLPCSAPPWIHGGALRMTTGRPWARPSPILSPGDPRPPVRSQRPRQGQRPGRSKPCITPPIAKQSAPVSVPQLAIATLISALLVAGGVFAQQKAGKDSVYEELNFFDEAFERVRQDAVDPVSDTKLIDAA